MEGGLGGDRAAKVVGNRPHCSTEESAAERLGECAQAPTLHPLLPVAFRIVDSNGSGSIELSELEFLLLNLYRRHAELARGNEGSRLRKRVEGDFRQVDRSRRVELSGSTV